MCKTWVVWGLGKNKKLDLRAAWLGGKQGCEEAGWGPGAQGPRE